MTGHLALAVRDEERSRRFYETYFGFDAAPAERMSDEVLMLYDADDFSLALKETDEPISLPGFLHFGFRSATSPGARFPRAPAAGRGSDRGGMG
jgi:catechol 2,3-dioxygenase-like lactoylglutathione lyase family enzyme